MPTSEEMAKLSHETYFNEKRENISATSLPTLPIAPNVDNIGPPNVLID